MTSTTVPVERSVSDLTRSWRSWHVLVPLSAVAGAVAATAPRLVLPVLAVLLVLRVLQAAPEAIGGLFAAAVLLRLPELAAGSGVLPQGAGQALTAAVVMVGLVRLLSDRRIPPALATAALLVVLVAVAVLLSALVSEVPRAAISGAGQVLADGSVAVALVLVLRSRRDLVLALRCLVLAGFVVATAGIVQELVGSTNELWGLAQTSSSTLAGETAGQRLGGPYGDANFFAQALLVVLALALALSVQEARRPMRLAARAAALAASVAVLLTYSRGGAVVLLLLAVAAMLRVGRLRRTLAIGALLLLAVTVFPWQPGTPVRAFVDRATSSSTDPSVQQRTLGLQTAAAMFVEHPVLGVGQDGFARARADYAPDAGLFEPRDPPLPPHSLYLHAAAETGAIGLAALVAALVVPVARLRRVARGAGGTALLAWGTSAAVLAYAAAAVLLPRAYPRLLWLVVGVALAAGGVLSESTSWHRDGSRRGDVGGQVGT